MGRLSGYSVEETPAYSAFAGYKDWFIFKLQPAPAIPLKWERAYLPCPLSQFDGIYSENVGILTYCQTAAG
jgi:g-D-glutamyl-meso-diaminopimelate peptidase